MRDNYVYDKNRNEFVKVTRSSWLLFKKGVKYFLVTASLAVVYYIVFSLVVSTDSERRLRRQNQMYKQLYAEMEEKEHLVGDVINGLKLKDSEIYNQLFKSEAPDFSDITEELYFAEDSISEGNIVTTTARKLESLEARGSRIEENFKAIAEEYSRNGGVLPPLSMPLQDFSYGRTGASVGEKVNPFYKVSVEHQGLDMISQQGDPVLAAADGVVRSVTRSSKGLGNVVTIDHRNGYYTRYAHLDNIKVSQGQKVTTGKQIGQVGMSGSSFAPHLHYEVMKDSLRVDPLNYMFGSVNPDEYISMLFMSTNTGQSLD